MPVTFNLSNRENQIRQARELAERRARNERQAPILGRFSGTVIDSETGLEWAGRDSGPITWTNANAFCEGLVLGGADDWGLPTLEQLEALLAAVMGGGLEENANGEHWFPIPGVRASYTRFWSSSRTMFVDFVTGAESRRLIAWTVDFGSGERHRVLHNNLDASPSPGSALCVRG